MQIAGWSPCHYQHLLGGTRKGLVKVTTRCCTMSLPACRRKPDAAVTRTEWQMQTNKLLHRNRPIHVSVPAPTLALSFCGILDMDNSKMVILSSQQKQKQMKWCSLEPWEISGIGSCDSCPVFSFHSAPCNLLPPLISKTAKKDTEEPKSREEHLFLIFFSFFPSNALFTPSCAFSCTVVLPILKLLWLSWVYPCIDVVDMWVALCL